MTDTEIQIRSGDARDAGLLAELGARTFRDSFSADNLPANMDAYLAAAFTREQLAAELAEPNSLFLLAEAGDSTVGYARLYEGPVPTDISGGRVIELVRIYALADWIGKGVGAALMDSCLEVAAGRGYDTMWLGVWAENQRAIAFYRRWGFVEVGTKPFRLGNDVQTDIVMQRAISADN